MCVGFVQYDAPLSIEETFSFDAGRDSITISPKTTYTLTISGSSTAPSKASSNSEIATWRRVGDVMELNYAYRPANNSGTSAGSGTYMFGLPGSYTIDRSKVKVGTANADNGHVGTAVVYVPGKYLSGWAWAYDTTHIALSAGNDTNAPAIVSAANTSITRIEVVYSFKASLPISGW